MLKSFRKFGLDFCDLPTMIQNVNTFLRILVLNIDKRDKRKIHLFAYIYTIIAGAVYVYAYELNAIWFIFWHCQRTGDKVSAIIVFSIAGATQISFAKLLYMYAYRDTIRNLVEGYLMLDSRTHPNSRMHFNLQHKLRAIKKRAVFLWCVIIFNAIGYVLRPILTPGRHTSEDFYIIYGLEPKLESPNWEISLVITALVASYIAILTANINAFLIVIIGYTQAQLLALTEELNNLWKDAEEDLVNIGHLSINNADSKEIRKIINGNVKRRLIEIIKNHILNIQLIKSVEVVFRGPLFIEFLMVTISLIAQLLGKLENTWMEMPFTFILITMDCITGQNLIDASEEFCRAVYNCQWENFDVSNAKMVLIILQNAQKTLTISAGGITTLSFMSLMSLFKSVYSAYTTLRTTYY